MTARAKEWTIFLLLFSSVIALFFWPVLFGGEGYYYGDYFQQQYPWAKVLAESLHRFSLPLWEPRMGAGFPLFAEGQIAAAHPLRLLLFSLLPFPVCYNAEFIALFFLSAVFTYLYARALPLSRSAASFATLTFIFGSAYSGLSIGLPALRTLAVLPLSFWAVEKMVKDEKRGAAFLAAAWALGFLGGMPQLAAYSVLASSAYLIWKYASLPEPRGRRLMRGLLGAGILGMGLAAIQILPTLELLRESSRAGASLGFALEKSFNPLNVFTLVWPGFGVFLGFQFYSGLATLIFALYGAAKLRHDRRAVFFSWFVLACLLLAMGRFNPLYVAWLKLTGSYVFRVPAKFLLYVSFGISMLAGVGLEHFLFETGEGRTARFWKTTGSIFAASLLVFAAAHIAARRLKEPIMDWFRQYIREHIAGQPGHPHSLDAYLTTLSGYYDRLVASTAWNDPWFLWVLGVWFVLAVVYGIQRFRPRAAKILVLFFFVLTIADLYHFSSIGSGLVGNRRPHAWVESDRTAEFLKTNLKGGRSFELVGASPADFPRWLPNSNLIHGYASAGLYTPLAPASYKEYLGDLGGVDDSTGFHPATPEALAAGREKLVRLGVRYLISKTGGEDVIEELKGDAPFFLESDPSASVEWKEDESGGLSVDVNAAAPDTLLTNRLFYPGWKVRIGGAPSELLKTEGVFQSVRVLAGKQHIDFVYRPFSFYAGAVLSLLSLVATILLFRRKQP